MPENSISEQIYAKFAESIKDNSLFDGLVTDLVSTMKQKQSKAKVKEILRKTENAHT